MDNIRTIKHYAWESKLCNLVDYNAIPTPPKLHLFVNAILDRVATYGPKVVTSLAVLYGADKLSYAELSIILYDISVLSNYMENFKHIPESIAEYIEFEKYVNIPLQSAKNNYIKHKPDAKSDAIVLDSCSFSWGPFTIQPLSLVVKQGSFVTVEGKVGGGKSSLMAALCGEMPLVCGNGAIYGKISYVGQKPWIMNATFRDNIVFGKEFDEQKYQRIIYACALYEDIQLLPFKDMSEIGRRGVNLSGGQKARLALA
ncbi:ATPase-like protein, partial [Coemansia sp. RSA 1086]